MIIDFYNRNGGGGGTTDTTMRASGFTGVDFENNVLSFNNLGGNEVGSVSLSGLTPDLSDYYTKSEIDAIESADTQSINTLQTAVSGNTDAISGLDTRVSANTDNISALSASTSANTENINALGIQVSANTEAIAEISGHTGGDATELQPKTAIPSSGAAGTVIAINKPDEYGWTSFIVGSGKSRTQISYYVEPSDNPNPDLSLYPTRYEITVACADSVDENGNYTYSNQTNVELSVDYQGNITFTNLGNFSQDGDGYSLTSDIYNTSTGENIQKTLYMSLENGYLYFNNGQGDCPYYISALQYYWTDLGYWDYDPETGEPTTWNESWTEMSNYVLFQSWGIANPAKIGIYQANSANTYVDYVAKNADYATEAGFARKLKMYQGDIHSDHFNAGDMIVPNEGDYRPLVKTGEGDGFDVDFIRLADNNDVAVLQQRINALQIDEVYAKEDTPVYVDNGNIIAVHNSGETVVKQAYAESGFTYVPMSWGDTGFYGVKQPAGTGFGLIYSFGDDTNRIMLNLWYNADDASNPYWQYSDLQNDGWNITETDNLTFTAEDPNGWGYTLSGYSDGTYVYCEWNVPAVEFYGGMAEEKRVPQTAYQTAVMSKQGLSQIVKLSQAEYDALANKDANTLYIIL